MKEIISPVILKATLQLTSCFDSINFMTSVSIRLLPCTGLLILTVVYWSTFCDTKLKKSRKLIKLINQHWWTWTLLKTKSSRVFEKGFVHQLCHGEIENFQSYNSEVVIKTCRSFLSVSYLKLLKHHCRTFPFYAIKNYNINLKYLFAPFTNKSLYFTLLSMCAFESKIYCGGSKTIFRMERCNKRNRETPTGTL